nr:zinc finger BED domain-containing protein RICESLEEPER 2-like [Ipomoea batatas]
MLSAALKYRAAFNRMADEDKFESVLDVGITIGDVVPVPNFFTTYSNMAREKGNVEETSNELDIYLMEKIEMPTPNRLAPYRGSCQRLILPSQRNGLPIVSFKHSKPTIKAHPTAMAATRDFQQQLRLHHVFAAQSDPTKPVTLHPPFPRLRLLVPGNQFPTPIVRHRTLDFVPQIVLLDAEPFRAVYGETIV